MDTHLRDLRYFVAAAEERQFSRAAERLYISQPALSKQIARLERTLRVPLFVRDARGVGLTPAGEALLPRARRLIADWDAAQRELSAARAAMESTLVVGIHTGVGRGLAGALPAALDGRRPGSLIRFLRVGWEDPSVGLASGDTDVAILWLPVPDRSDLAWEVLFTEPRMVLLAAGHALASRSAVALEDLADEPFLALPDSAGPMREFWLGADAGLAEPRIAAVVRSVEETFEAVAGRTGVALVAEGNVALYAHDGVVARPVAGIAPAELAVAWRRDDPRDLIADFVAACLSAARSRG